MKRPKRRLDHLVDAFEACQKAGVSLSEIELRTCSRDLKDQVKMARQAQKDLAKALGLAITVDLPTKPPLRR